ncbi:MAG TPA: class I mannose-6-phosphate isomerase [Candidatus Goldiibacteriota bacterium]|nr:class I mannose-6-phosphate isomerase [Candidatus Goldiibacteriota bacterium]HPN63615.1 class I mannose-6-phosphate isomerase [Candidatus Goldiibacteriota bacterium]
MEIKMYPIKVKPIFKDMIWGGKALKDFMSAPDSRIGEAWFFASTDSVSSVIANGKFKGQKLTDTVKKYGDELLGPEVNKKYKGRFPLLFKFIDSAHKLSVQIHPDDKIARKKGLNCGKTEMWFIIGAQKGGVIQLGLKKHYSKDKIKSAALNGDLPEMLREYRVKPGDCFLIPAGTVHAIGGGLLIFEVQQNADITYRLFDWGRLDKGKPRQLHLNEALMSFKYGLEKKGNDKFKSGRGMSVRKLPGCCYFNTTEVKTSKKLLYLEKGRRPLVAAVIAGEMRVEGGYVFKRGDIVFLPYSYCNYIIKFGKGAHIIFTEVK